MLYFHFVTSGSFPCYSISQMVFHSILFYFIMAMCVYMCYKYIYIYIYKYSHFRAEREGIVPERNAPAVASAILLRASMRGFSKLQYEYTVRAARCGYVKISRRYGLLTSP